MTDPEAVPLASARRSRTESCSTNVLIGASARLAAFADVGWTARAAPGQATGGMVRMERAGGEHALHVQKRVKRFTGGMNLARPFGRHNRVNATVPLAIMTISEDEVSIGPIRPLAKILPIVHLSRHQVRAVRRSKGLLTPGVAVSEADGVYFFWTWRGRRLVANLEALGYQSEPPVRQSLWRLSGRSNRPIG